MSQVEESRKGWGSWEINWKKNVPISILDACDPYRNPFSLLKVYGAEIKTDQVGQIDPIYTGVTISSKNSSGGRSLSGYGPGWFMGEEGGSVWEPRNSVGPYSSTSVTYTAITGTLLAWLTSMLSVTKSGLTPGIIFSGHTAKFAWTVQAHTVRSFMDSFISQLWDVEYRINPDLTVDVGDAIQLWPQSDKQPIAVRKGSRDVNYYGLQTSDVALNTEFENWVQRATVMLYNNTFETYDNPFICQNPQGDDMTYGHIFNNDDTGITTAMAQGLVKQSVLQNGSARGAELSVKEYEINGRVKAGGWIWVWDPEAGYWDQLNPQTYQGEPIYPVRLRVEAVTWPIQVGMGVFLDKGHITGHAGEIVDLTPYLEFESADATSSVKVGSPPPTLGRRSRAR